MGFAAVACASLSAWYLKLETCGRYLTQVQADDMAACANQILGNNCAVYMLFLFSKTIAASSNIAARHVLWATPNVFGASTNPSSLAQSCPGPLMIRFLKYYKLLADRHAVRGQLRYPLKPRFHLLQEVTISMQTELYSARFFHCYQDEDMIGQVKHLCRRVHRKWMEFRILCRWLLRLSRWQER